MDHRTTIALWADDELDPEPCPSAHVGFDPRDPRSVRAAQRALQQQLGLRYLPTLCSEPRPGLFTRLAGAIGALWQRSEPLLPPARRAVPVRVPVPAD
jgi:hypothetical protein